MMRHLDLILILLTFWLILGYTVANAERRTRLFSRSLGQWAVDLFGLTMHGTVVPLFQSFVLVVLFSKACPTLGGIWDIPAPLAFLLSFVLVDYAYYWNHRLLHTEKLWRFHSLHHSGETFDVFTTSRNSWMTTFLILYVWVHGAALYLLRHPEAYLWGAALSNILDILRHAGFEAWPKRAPFSWIISPRDHAWHHSSDLYGVNFGGNLNLWDRLHGTYHVSLKLPERTGAPLNRSLWQAFWKGSV